MSKPLPSHATVITLFAASAGLAASTTDASVIYNSNSVLLSNGGTWFLEGNGGTTVMGTLALGAGYGSFPRNGANGFRLSDVGYESPLNLAFGAPVPLPTGAGDGRNVSFNTGAVGAQLGYDWGATFTVGTAAYVGFVFNLGEGTQFGWMNVTLLPGTGGFRINNWAYEDQPGVGINVGDGIVAVPEPATVGLGLLALGVAGREVYRRRRNPAKAEAAAVAA